MNTDAHQEIPHLQFLSSRILFRILDSRTKSDLEAILADPELGKHKMNTNKYHHLKLTLSKEQLEDSISCGLFRKDGSINETKLSQESPATQLLYAFLWKQGDLQKVKHIVQGITGHEPPSESGLVLYYFGKHLADKRNPIIDQHVIRAFALATNKPRFNEDTLSKKDIDNINAYINWFQTVLPEEITNSEECRYLVDQILYALGKKLKKEVAGWNQIIYSNNGR